MSEEAARRPETCIRPMETHDWPAVSAIYAEGIATGDATFETEVPSWAAFDADRLHGLRLVAERPSGELVAWAAVSATSSRPVYAGVGEHSIYVGEQARGRGVGRLLLDAIVRASEDAGIWTLQTRIFPENEASIALHLRCGFRVVGTQERLGCMGGRWRDVVVLERRSDRAGVAS
ncbi:MAG: GNAT family N-acetyltransferase [Actinomycetes bacterium]